jgi:hypothetical protein
LTLKLTCRPNAAGCGNRDNSEILTADRLAKKHQWDRQRPGRKREIVNLCTTMVKTTTAEVMANKSVRQDDRAASAPALRDATSQPGPDEDHRVAGASSRRLSPLSNSGTVEASAEDVCTEAA